MGFFKYLFNNFMGGHHGSNYYGKNSRHHSGYDNNQYLPRPEQQCSNCNTMQSSNAKFCANCGVSIVGTTCVCGTLLTTGSKFCNNCGKPV